MKYLTRPVSVLSERQFRGIMWSNAEYYLHMRSGTYPSWVFERPVKV